MKKTPFLSLAPFALLALLPLVVLLCCPPMTCAAEADTGNALAAADINGGYSGQVLAKVSRLWAPPPDTINRRVSLRLRIDGDGNLSQCDFTTASDMTAMNKAACEAAREAGNFGVPPYGMPTEVYMTFWTGRPRREAKENTANPAPKSMPVAAATPAPAQATPKVQAPASVPDKTPAQAPAATTVPGKPQTPAAVKPAVQPVTPSKPPAASKSDAVKAPHAPEVVKTTKTPQTPAKPSQSGLSGESDAATTPIKASAPPSTPPKSATAKPDTAKEEDGKGKAAAVKQQSVKSTPPTPSKPAGIRTQFAPYRDPKAKSVPEERAMPNAAQQHYAQAIATHFQMRLIPPDKLKAGKYTVGVKLSVNGGGEVGEAELSRSSGQSLLDEAVLRLLLRAEKVLPPPDKQPQNLNLTFTVHKP